MKTQTIVIAVLIIQSFLWTACAEDKKEKTETQSINQSSTSVKSQHISEEKTAVVTETKTHTQEKTKDENPENLMDMQAKVYTDVFGKLGGVEELQGIEGYMDLVEKMDASPETKKQLTEHYELYSKSLDPEKKEELKAQLNALLLKAMK